MGTHYYFRQRALIQFLARLKRIDAHRAAILYVQTGLAARFAAKYNHTIQKEQP